MNRYHHLALLFVAVLVITRCTPHTAPTSPLPDDATDSVRIVVVGPSLTDALLALGQGSRIVGTCLSSRHLPDADTARWANVGYHRALNAEGILALNPTLVVLDAEAGPQPVLQALQASGVRTLNLPASTSPTEAIATVRSLGQALGASNTDILANALQVGFDSLSRAADARATKPSILVLYARGGPERLFMLGRGTVAHNISSLLGARQAATFEGSKPLAPEAVLQAAPEWLLMPAETYNSLGGAEGIKLHTLLGNTPAGRHGKVLVVPDGALFGFGPSTLQVIRNLKRAMNARN